MRRLPLTLLAVALVCLALSSAVPTQATPRQPPANPNAQGNHRGQGQGRQAQPRITWSSARVVQTVAPGTSATIKVQVKSSVDVAELSMWIPGALAKVTTISNAPTSLKAGVPATVELTFTMPATDAHSQGGVVKVRIGQRTVPANLHVKLTVPGALENGD